MKERVFPSLATVLCLFPLLFLTRLMRCLTHLESVSYSSVLNRNRIFLSSMRDQETSSRKHSSWLWWNHSHSWTFFSFQMATNTSVHSAPVIHLDLFDKNMRLVNFVLSCTGVFCNFTLFIVLLLIGRRQCTTYFLLLLMTGCDFLYCVDYVSIVLTVEHYMNIINYQILCPLSFFLTPFTFTGSTLLLLICLLHFITNFVRKYDTILGQIGGRLSVVFVLAFILIRSVLNSNSVELIIVDSIVPPQRFCTIDMNIPAIVEAVQKFNHIFAEVTDILIYIGWISIVMIYVINSIRCRRSYLYDENDPELSSTAQPTSFASLCMTHNSSQHTHCRASTVALEMNSTDLFTTVNETAAVLPITNKQRHRSVSLIIVSISCLSIALYLPNIIYKYSIICSTYYQYAPFSEKHTLVWRTLQQSAHLLCLSIRFLPYFVFEKRIHSLLTSMIGIKCMARETTRPRSKRRGKPTYTWHCRCHRRHRALSLYAGDDKYYRRGKNLV